MSTFLDGWNPLTWTLLDRVRFALTVPFLLLFLYFLFMVWIPAFASWILEWNFTGFPELVFTPNQCIAVFSIIAGLAFWSWFWRLLPVVRLP